MGLMKYFIYIELVIFIVGFVLCDKTVPIQKVLKMFFLLSVIGNVLNWLNSRITGFISREIFNSVYGNGTSLFSNWSVDVVNRVALIVLIVLAIYKIITWVILVRGVYKIKKNEQLKYESVA